MRKRQIATGFGGFLAFACMGGLYGVCRLLVVRPLSHEAPFESLNMEELLFEPFNNSIGKLS